MNRRNVLIGGVAVSASLALASIVSVFLGSLAPSEAAKANAPSFPLTDAALGSFVELAPENQPGRLFVYRAASQDLTIFWFGYDPRLKQYHAYEPFTQCAAISISSARLDCMYEGAVQVSWGLSGQPSKPWFPVLHSVGYSVSGGRVRYGAGA